METASKCATGEASQELDFVSMGCTRVEAEFFTAIAMQDVRKLRSLGLFSERINFDIATPFLPKPDPGPDSRNPSPPERPTVQVFRTVNIKRIIWSFLSPQFNLNSMDEACRKVKFVQSNALHKIQGGLSKRGRKRSFVDFMFDEGIGFFGNRARNTSNTSSSWSSSKVFPGSGHEVSEVCACWAYLFELCEHNADFNALEAVKKAEDSVFWGLPLPKYKIGPLHLAVTAGHLGAILCLLQKGTRVDIDEKCKVRVRETVCLIRVLDNYNANSES